MWYRLHGDIPIVCAHLKHTSPVLELWRRWSSGDRAGKHLPAVVTPIDYHHHQHALAPTTRCHLSVEHALSDICPTRHQRAEGRCLRHCWTTMPFNGKKLVTVNAIILVIFYSDTCFKTRRHWTTCSLTMVDLVPPNLHLFLLIC